jgi:hypothetical protein
LFFLRGEFSAQNFPYLIGIDAPNLTKVFGDAVLFLGRKIAKGAAEKNQCAFELVIGERSSVFSGSPTA